MGKRLVFSKRGFLKLRDNIRFLYLYYMMGRDLTRKNLVVKLWQCIEGSKAKT